MKKLPDNVIAQRSTPVFTQDTIPAGLLKDHKTGPGTWGVLNIEKGTLEYTIGDDEVHVLTPETAKGIIEPEVLHRVRPIEEVEFFVEFHKAV